MPPAAFVQLIGSVPLATTEEVMNTICETLSDRIYRVPDGEIGERSFFVLWQASEFWPKEVLSFRPRWMNIPEPDETRKDFLLTRESLPSTTGYAEHALSSYKVFCSLRDSGAIPKAVKFQVSLPSRAAAVSLLLLPPYQVKGEQLFEEVLSSDLAAIQDAIPHHDLAIQWDMLGELLFFEHDHGQPSKIDKWFWNQLHPYFEEPLTEGIAARMARLALLVHPDVDMGLHLCYGDAKHEHFAQPVDTAILAEVLDCCLRNSSRPIAWAHLPVPMDRTDEAYFEPLRSLDLGKTSLVLGLVHANDEQGTEKRLATAQKVLGNVSFGISTPCGLGRTPKEHLSSVFQILKDNSESH